MNANLDKIPTPETVNKEPNPKIVTDLVSRFIARTDLNSPRIDTPRKD